MKSHFTVARCGCVVLLSAALKIRFTCLEKDQFLKMKFLVLFCAVIALASAYELTDIVSARIETCRGCSLNRLPKVKQFVMEDAPSYDRVEVKFITGAPPELVLLAANDHELERLPLAQLDREECNKLMQDKGFTKKQKSEF